MFGRVSGIAGILFYRLHLVYPRIIIICSRVIVFRPPFILWIVQSVEFTGNFGMGISLEISPGGAREIGSGRKWKESGDVTR